MEEGIVGFPELPLNIFSVFPVSLPLLPLARIVAVNGQAIDNMHHEEIIKQIKDSGYVVTLTIGAPQDQVEGPSGDAPPPEPPQQHPQQLQQPQDGNPIQQMQYTEPTQQQQLHLNNNVPVNGNDNLDPPSYHSPPQSQLQHQQQQQQQQYPMATSDEAGNAYLSIDLHRGNRGFGFSIRGGQVGFRP